MNATGPRPTLSPTKPQKPSCSSPLYIHKRQQENAHELVNGLPSAMRHTHSHKMYNTMEMEIVVVLFRYGQRLAVHICMVAYNPVCRLLNNRYT